MLKAEQVTPDSRSDARRRLRGRFVLGLVVGVATLGIAVHGVNWQELVASLSAVDPSFVLLAVLCSLLEIASGAVRWQTLLRPLGRFRMLSDCLDFYLIGLLFNGLLPARPGEIIRSVVFARTYSVSKISVLSNALVEKWFDVLALLVIMVVLITVMDIPREIRGAGALLFVGMLAVYAVLLHVARGGKGLRWTRKAATWLPERLRAKSAALLIASRAGLQTLTSAKEALRTGFWTGCMWLSAVAVTHFYIEAFSVDLAWHGAAFVLLIANFGRLLPSSPGAIGVAHAFYVLGLTLLGVDKATALAIAIVIHGIGFLQILSLGFISLWRRRISFGIWTHAH